MTEAEIVELVAKALYGISPPNAPWGKVLLGTENRYRRRARELLLLTVAAQNVKKVFPEAEIINA